MNPSSSSSESSFDLTGRLAFAAIDEDTRRNLVSLGMTLRDQMPKALDGFYSHIQKFSDTKAHFMDASAMARAHKAQMKHWERICEGSFSAEYASSVRRIGSVHAKIGLEPKWYIGAYSFISGPLVSTLLETAGNTRNPFTRKKALAEAAGQISAFFKAVLLDVELSLSVYFEEAERARREAEEAQEAAGAAAAKAAQEAVVAAFGQVFSALAVGNLSAHVTADVPATFASMKTDLNEAIDALAKTIGTTRETASSVATSSAEITAGAEDLAMRTEQQAASLEETAATTEQLAASVKATAQASRVAVEHAEDARSTAMRGEEIAGLAVEAMARIEKASEKISEITTVIDEIAFQTNLLALNAAVEAARAGDAGKGFAVVAAEVRTLAQRSSEAAKDIGGLISSSTAEVSQGVRFVREAGDTLRAIVGASDKVSEAVREISSATSEQANGIDEMSQVVASMDQMTQQNAALAEQTSASAMALTQQIDALNETIRRFEVGAHHKTSSSRIAAAHPGTRGTSKPKFADRQHAKGGYRLRAG